ncbi:MAG: hypothetical protein LBG19_13265 [Prevotellaceae bacterium]|nr:hypothetical protein [Prevotellaceae bacterium]
MTIAASEPAAFAAAADAFAANGADRIDGIGSFRGLREVRPAKLRGVRERTFHSRVNERELSDSCGNKNIYLTLPGSFRKAPLKLS